MEEKEFSQLDLGGVLRSAHEDKNKALRITSANSSVPPRYSRVSLTYNVSDSVTNATFYEGLFAEDRHITFISDVAGSLNNDYFTLHSENNESLYHVWYNVSGGGTDPAPVGSTGIEIAINTGDAAEIVMLATRLCLKRIHDVRVRQLTPKMLRITNSRKGLATNTVDAGTGFLISTVQEGAEKLIKSVDIPYDGKNLYGFNTQEKKFEIFATSAGVLSGEIDLKNPNTMEMINKTIATKNVEVSQVLPNGTKRYTIKVREGKGRLRLAFVSTETGTNYETIERGYVWDSEAIDIPDSTTIYLLSTADAVVAEIKVWRRV